MHSVDPWCATRTVASWTLAALALAAASGCGGGKDKPASQVAARVNKEEITVHQVDHAQQSQRGRSDAADPAVGARALEKLIEQELAVQKAQALKIDRDPKVMQQMAAARSDILARAYFDKIAEGVAKPTPEEVTAYFNEQPALFRERRIYQLQEVLVQAKDAQVESIRRLVTAGKPLEEVLIYLRSNSINYTTNQIVRAAEQVPLGTLPTLSKLRAGQSMVVTGPAGVQVIAVTESRLQPIDEDRARPAIEQFLVNDRKRRVVAEDLKALRTAAKVEYVGTFAASAPGAADPTLGAADAAVAATRGSVPPVASTPTAGTAAAGQTAGASASATSAPTSTSTSAAQQDGSLNNSIINKGLGLK